MKIKVLIISICVIITGVLVVILLIRRPEQVKINDIKRFYFSYSNGYMANSNVIYELEMNSYGCNITIKPYEIPEEEKMSLYVGDVVCKKVEDVLNKYNVIKWDGFKVNDPYVLDGDSFSMSLTLKDGTNISASGYMKWPENYIKVRNELDDIFMQIYDETDRSN